MYVQEMGCRRHDCLDSSWFPFVFRVQNAPFLGVEGSTSHIRVLKPVSVEKGRGKHPVTFLLLLFFSVFQLKIVNMPRRHVLG